MNKPRNSPEWKPYLILAVALCLVACAEPPAGSSGAIESGALAALTSSDGSAVGSPTAWESERFGVVTGGIYRQSSAATTSDQSDGAAVQTSAFTLDQSADRIFLELKNGVEVGWIRVEANWDGLPHRLLGRIVEKAHAKGLRVIVLLQPELGGGAPTDADISAYINDRLDPMLRGAFISNASKPDAIEVGNELNGTRWNGNMAAWLTRRTKEFLLRDLRWRNIQVISAGTLNVYAREINGEQIWFNDFFNAGAFACDFASSQLYGCVQGQRFMPFDHMGVHPYNTYQVSKTCINSGSVQCFDGWKQQVRDDLAFIQSRLAQASGQWTELMVTEFGWQTPPYGWNTTCPKDNGLFHNCVQTEDQMRAAMQASYEAFHSSSGSWMVRAALWYSYQDEPGDPSTHKHFGLRDSNHVVKNAVWQKLRGLAGNPYGGDPDVFWRGARFLDVPSEHWASGFIDRLATDFIVDGKPDGYFYPEASDPQPNFLTRGDFATYLTRALTGFDPPPAPPRPYCSWQLQDPGNAQFVDVPVSHPQFQYIQTLVAANVISGYADGTFRPNNALTRGQAAKMFALANRWPLLNPPQGHFNDVPPGSTFYTYVETVYAHGLISGYADGTFRPYNPLTRAQISKLLYINFVQNNSWNNSCGPQWGGFMDSIGWDE